MFLSWSKGGKVVYRTGQFWLVSTWHLAFGCFWNIAQSWNCYVDFHKMSACQSTYLALIDDAFPRRSFCVDRGGIWRPNEDENGIRDWIGLLEIWTRGPARDRRIEYPWSELRIAYSRLSSKSGSELPFLSSDIIYRQQVRLNRRSTSKSETTNAIKYSILTMSVWFSVEPRSGCTLSVELWADSENSAKSLHNVC